MSETRRIFLIEPDAEMRDRVEAVLLGAGYEVTRPEGTDEPARQIGRRAYDAVVVSFSWLGSDPGKTLRELTGAESPPVLVLCDAGQVREAVRLLQQGAEDYLTRPPDPLELRGPSDSGSIATAQCCGSTAGVLQSGGIG